MRESSTALLLANSFDGEDYEDYSDVFDMIRLAGSEERWNVVLSKSMVLPFEETRKYAAHLATRFGIQDWCEKMMILITPQPVPQELLANGENQDEVGLERYAPNVDTEFVNTTEGLAKVNELIRCETLECVAMDCEWFSASTVLPPTGSEKRRPAILQLAFEFRDADSCSHRACIILDLLALPIAPLTQTLTMLMRGSTFRLLGFAPAEDLILLRALLPEMPKDRSHVIDLAKQSFTAAKGVVASTKNNPLGNRLDKTSRISNWERRPLRVAQMTYAMCDVVILLDLWRVCNSRGS